MEVVLNSSAVQTDSPSPIPEPKQPKSDIEQMSEAIAKAERISVDIRSKVLQPTFTVAKMAELMRIGYGVAQEKINFIAQFGYANNKMHNGIMHFELVADPMQRIKSIEETVLRVKEKYEADVRNLKAMREITSGYVKEVEAKKE